MTHENPFEQVLAREQEHDRAAREALAVLDDERMADENALAAEQREKVDRANAQARQSIDAFRATELPRMQREGEVRANDEAERISRESNRNIDAAAALVVETALSADFPSLL